MEAVDKKRGGRGMSKGRAEVRIPQVKGANHKQQKAFVREMRRSGETESKGGGGGGADLVPGSCGALWSSGDPWWSSQSPELQRHRFWRKCREITVSLGEQTGVHTSRGPDI